jgi:hypothetical protein
LTQGNTLRSKTKGRRRRRNGRKESKRKTAVHYSDLLLHRNLSLNLKNNLMEKKPTILRGAGLNIEVKIEHASSGTTPKSPMQIPSPSPHLHLKNNNFNPRKESAQSIYLQKYNSSGMKEGVRKGSPSTPSNMFQTQYNVSPSMCESKKRSTSPSYMNSTSQRRDVGSKSPSMQTTFLQVTNSVKQS